MTARARTHGRVSRVRRPPAMDADDVQPLPTEQARTFHLDLERELQAAPERVFDLLTEPEQLTKWWGPRGFTTTEIHRDLRVGGGYRLTMQPPDGEAFHLSGAYLEIDPPHRLRYTFRWDEPTPDDRETVVVLDMSPRGEATLVSLSQGEFATEERLELHCLGWADSLDRPEAVLQSPTA